MLSTNAFSHVGSPVARNNGSGTWSLKYKTVESYNSCLRLRCGTNSGGSRLPELGAIGWSELLAGGNGFGDGSLPTGFMDRPRSGVWGTKSPRSRSIWSSRLSPCIIEPPLGTKKRSGRPKKNWINTIQQYSKSTGMTREVASATARCGCRRRVVPCVVDLGWTKV